MKKNLFLIFSVIFIIFSCQEEKKDVGNNKLLDSLSKDYSQSKIVKINDKIFNIPSPIHIASLVKEKNIPLNVELLNNTEYHTKYLTSFKQALNIGVYGTNLGNLFVYNNLSGSLEYFNIIKILSEQVGITNIINQNFFDRIERNIDNKDSLMFILADLYRKIDSYSLENDQAEIGMLILTGGWVESLYLLSKIVELDKDPAIIERIGEQKIPLNNIIELLQANDVGKTEECNFLMNSLIELATYFDNIEINYVYQKSTTDAEKKYTIINSSTTYNISNEDLLVICQKIEELREWIIAE